MMTVNAAMAALAAEMRAEGIGDPLGAVVTLAALWGDLCGLAGEATPPEVRARLGGITQEEADAIVLASRWADAIEECEADGCGWSYFLPDGTRIQVTYGGALIEVLMKSE